MIEVADSQGPAVFIHVPRTGGSCIWHYLTTVCLNTCDFLDIHHESIKRFGHERFALQAMSIYLSDIRRLERFAMIHHHGIGPLNSMVENASYFTILRNPVDRLISYFEHVKAQQISGNRTNEIEARDLGILEFYSKTPWHLTGYCSWFGAMMWEKAGIYPKEFLLDVLEPPPPLLASIKNEGENYVGTLAQFMRENFCVIADFDNISTEAKNIARHYGATSDLPQLPENKNAKSGSVVSPDIKSELGAMCELDTILFNKLIHH